MSKEQIKPIGMLERLEQKSRSNYEKVARRMRTAAQIADAMHAAGLSKKKFAEVMGRQPSEITKWLSGTHNFTSDTLAEISVVLGREIPGPGDAGGSYGYVDEGRRTPSRSRRSNGGIKELKFGEKAVWSDIPYSLLTTNKGGYGCKC